MTDFQVQHDISELVSRYFRALGERRFDGEWAAEFFTDDITVASPHGIAEGEDAVRQSRDAVEAWAAIQYLNTDLIVDVDPADPTRASASWNALMTHTPQPADDGEDTGLFTVGGVWEARVRLTADGWRFSHTGVRPIWTTGQVPAAMAA